MTKFYFFPLFLFFIIMAFGSNGCFVAGQDLVRQDASLKNEQTKVSDTKQIRSREKAMTTAVIKNSDKDRTDQKKLLSCGERKTLNIVRCAIRPVLDGKGSDPCWSKIVPVTDFIYPWLNEKPEKTSLKICYDDENLYLLYEVDDHTPVFLKQQNKKMDLIYEDRVEIFLSADEQMSLYYGIEMSPTGMVLDYLGHYYRQFVYDWSMPELIVKGNINKDGYSVEASFSLNVLKKLGVLKDDNTMLAGFYRADFKYGSDGGIIKRWISWIDPKIEKEDFHVPQSLGRLFLK